MIPSLAALVRAANSELLGAGNVEAIPKFFAPEYVVHLTRQDLAGGAPEIRKVIELYRRGFPDLTVEVEILLEGPDRIAWQRTLRGVQNGSFKGFPASGREIVWRELVVSRFSEGRIAEEWLSTDLAEQLLLARKR